MYIVHTVHRGHNFTQRAEGRIARGWRGGVSEDGEGVPGGGSDGVPEDRGGECQGVEVKECQRVVEGRSS